MALAFSIEDRFRVPCASGIGLVGLEKGSEEPHYPFQVIAVQCWGRGRRALPPIRPLPNLRKQGSTRNESGAGRYPENTCRVRRHPCRAVLTKLFNQGWQRGHRSAGQRLGTSRTALELHAA